MDGVLAASMTGYTIDIQLTELGFPDLFQNEGTGTKTSPAIASDNSSCTQPNCQTSSTHSLHTRNSLADPGPNTEQGSHLQERLQIIDPKDITDHKSKPSQLGCMVAKPKTVPVRRKGRHKPHNGGRKEKGGRRKRDAGARERGMASTGTENSDASEEDEDEEEEMALSDVPADSTGQHCCKVCNLTLPSAFRLQEHMHLHSGARPYRCAECGKQFCHLANYRTHLRKHAQAAGIRCRVCNAGFDMVGSLQVHMERAHLTKRIYQCEICNLIFSCPEECQRHADQQQGGRHFCRHKSLLRHSGRHEPRASYLCTECGQAFPRKTALLRHSFSHLGLLPYTCVRCQRHFRLASLYRRHVCEPERIQCVACLAFFHSQRDFARHKEETGCWGHLGARAGGLRCMECGQAFGSAEELKEHAGAHQRVLRCSECGKGFRSSLLLMSHMGGHAGSRPCFCQHCGLGFPHQQAYDGHREHCGRVGSGSEPSAAKVDQSAKRSIRSGKSSASQEKVWQFKLNETHPPVAAVAIVPLHARSTASEPMEVMSPSKMVKGMGHMIKREHECASNVQSEIGFSPIGTGDLGSSDLIQAECEIVSEERINVKQEVESQGSTGVEDGDGGDTGGFHSVEVEVWDEVAENDYGDEPHECVDCGQILLDGKLLEHYMQHARQRDWPFPEPSAPTGARPRPSSTPSRPKRKRRRR